MRHFHYKRNPDYAPSINIDRLWSLVPEGVFEKAQAGAAQAPVIDVTKLVCMFFYDILNMSFLHFYFTITTLSMILSHSFHLLLLINYQQTGLLQSAR